MLYLSPLFNGVRASQISGTLLQDFSFKPSLVKFIKGRETEILLSVAGCSFTSQ